MPLNKKPFRNRRSYALTVERLSFIRSAHKNDFLLFKLKFF